MPSLRALVAQWTERLRPKEGVGGSIPSEGAIINLGEVPERLNGPDSKSGILPKGGSWVRIPPSPPE